MVLASRDSPSRAYLSQLADQHSGGGHYTPAGQPSDSDGLALAEAFALPGRVPRPHSPPRLGGFLCRSQRGSFLRLRRSCCWFLPWRCQLQSCSGLLRRLSQLGVRAEPPLESGLGNFDQEVPGPSLGVVLLQNLSDGCLAESLVW